MEIKNINLLSDSDNILRIANSYVTYREFSSQFIYIIIDLLRSERLFLVLIKINTIINYSFLLETYRFYYPNVQQVMNGIKCNIELDAVR